MMRVLSVPGHLGQTVYVYLVIFTPVQVCASDADGFIWRDA